MNPLPLGWLEQAQRVQEEVNQFPYKSDPERYGKPELWAEIDATGGDCEDYAIAKLHRLVALGFPIERLRLATCLVGWKNPEQQEGHAVLVVDAPADQYVLDNRFPDVVTLPVLIGDGYTLEKIQRIGGSREWTRWEFK